MIDKGTRARLYTAPAEFGEMLDLRRQALLAPDDAASLDRRRPGQP